MKFLKDLNIVISSTCIQKNSNRYAEEPQMIHFEVFLGFLSPGTQEPLRRPPEYHFLDQAAEKKERKYFGHSSKKGFSTVKLLIFFANLRRGERCLAD